MDNQKQRVLSNGPNCYPSLLFSNPVVPQRESMRIVKDKNSVLKSNTMFAQFPPVLVFVPLKPHPCSRATI